MSNIIEDVKRTPIPFKQKLTFVLLGLVILCSGFGMGVSLTVNKLKDRLGPPGPTPPPFMDHLERIAKEYSLSPEQKEQAKPILEAYHESFRLMWTDSMQKMSLARDSMIAKMKQILTVDQYDRWFRDLQEQEKRFKQRRPFDRRGDRGGRRDRGDRGGPPPGDWDPTKMSSEPNRPPRWRRDDRNRDSDMNLPSQSPRPSAMQGTE